MATIQIKRNNSNAATKPSSLLVGELAGNLLDRSLFSSDGSNVFQFYTGTTKWFDTSGNANNANKLGGTAASSYATQTWIENKKYLTAHQSIYSFTIKNSAGTAQVTYTPNSKAASLTLTKAMVGLSNVENTALSTWVGSAKITTLGTITSGTWNGTKIANSYLANSSMTIAGTSVSLGGSITAATLKTNLGLGSLAYKSSLVASDIPSLDWSKITSGKPTTAAGYGIVDALTFTNNDTYVGANMPSSDLSKLAASAYVELWDSAGWWNLKAAKYIVAGGTSSQFLKGDGSLDGASYLPLGGGTLTGNLSAPLYLFGNGGGTYLDSGASGELVFYDLSARRTVLHSGNYSSYALPLTGGTLTGVLTIHADNVSGQQQGLVLSDPGYGGNEALKIVWKSSTYADGVYLVGRPDINVLDFNGNTVIHSGNIGSQSVDRAIALRGIYPSVKSTNDLYNTEQLLKYHAGFSPDLGNVPSSDSWQNGLLEIGLHSDGASAQFFFSAYKRLYYRSHQTDAWHGVAYLTDNVASATKLKTARTIWGQSFDGTANVSGVLTLPANHQIQWVNSNSMIYGNGSNITISNTGNLTIATSGNVLIGTTTDSGYKLDVNGTSVVRDKAAFRHTILADRYNGQGNTAGAALIVNKGGDYFGVGASSSNISNISLGWVNDLEGTWKKELVTINASNNIILNQGVYISATDSANTARGILELTTSQNRFILGYGIASAGYDTSLQGNNIEFTYGTSHSVGMKLTSGGNILMGTIEDSRDKLRINGSIRAAGHIRLDRYHGASEYLQLEAEDVNINYRAYDTDGWCSHNFYSNDNLLVKIDGYAGKLDVNGNLVATGDGVFGSDARYKSKLQDLAVDIETIANAPVFSYKWADREDDKVHLGTTAQYWLDTNFRDAVDTSNKDFYHLNYGALGVAIGASLAKKTVDHEERIKALEKENKELKNELKQLKQWHN